MTDGSTLRSVASGDGALSVIPIRGIPEVTAGDDLAGMILAGLSANGVTLGDGDVLVVTSKVVSKALGLRRATTDRGAVVEEETVRVVAERATATGVTRIVEGRSGAVTAAAGVDGSNSGPSGEVLVLPVDPDAITLDLRVTLEARVPRVRFGVILSDTAGRPWRVGQTDFALGAAGVEVCADHRGGMDADGRPLEVTVRAVADELAAAGDLVKGKAERCPVALVSGAGRWVLGRGEPGPGARRLLRVGPGDFFALGHVEAARAALGIEPGSPSAAEVGIRSAVPETVADRIARALRAARLGEPEGTDITVTQTPTGILTIRGIDAYAVGRLAARLEVALWSEDLAGVIGVRSVLP